MVSVGPTTTWDTLRSGAGGRRQASGSPADVGARCLADSIAPTCGRNPGATLRRRLGREPSGAPAGRTRRRGQTPRRRTPCRRWLTRGTPSSLARLLPPDRRLAAAPAPADDGAPLAPARPPVDPARHAAVALEVARQGLVRLKKGGVLPLAPDHGDARGRVGGHAQLGVPAGTGSSAVTPPGGYAAVVAIGGTGFMGGRRNLYLLPSSPLEALRRLVPHARLEYDPGMHPAEAAPGRGARDSRRPSRRRGGTRSGTQSRSWPWALGLLAPARGNRWRPLRLRTECKPTVYITNPGAARQGGWAARRPAPPPCATAGATQGGLGSPAERNPVSTGRGGFFRFGSSTASRRTSRPRRASTSEMRPPRRPRDAQQAGGLRFDRRDAGLDLLGGQPLRWRPATLGAPAARPTCWGSRSRSSGRGPARS